jgi:hypothetical protein
VVENQEIDTLREKAQLYRWVKERIERLRKLEGSEGGLPIPETRENIALALALLEKIRDEIKEGVKSTTDEIREEVFGKWKEKIEKGQ